MSSEDKIHFTCGDLKKDYRKIHRNSRCWKECVGFDWYSFGEICYCTYQLIWILQRDNWEHFRNNEYPPETDFIDRVQKSKSHRATFENAKLVYTVVNERLENSGVVDLDWFMDALAPENVIYKYLNPRTKEMLNYLSGSWDKWITFTEWKTISKHNKKISQK